MSITRLGICAPYTRIAATYMSCVVGDYAQHLGIPVSYRSSQKHDQRVHEKWDGRVRSFKREPDDRKRRADQRRWIRQQSHILWSHVDADPLIFAHRHGVHNTLLVLPDQLDPGWMRAAALFDEIVCPSNASYEWCRRLPYPTRLICWDAGLAPPAELVLSTEGPPRLLVLVDGNTARSQGIFLFSVLSVLLSSHASLEITVAHTRSWARGVDCVWRSLAEKYGPRLQFRAAPTLRWRCEAYTQHHWTWLPHRRPATAFYAIEALSLNCPVITYDVPPMNEVVYRGHNGHLLPCASHMLTNGCQEVEPNARAILAGLEETLETLEYNRVLRQKPWPDVERRKMNFMLGWNHIWQIR